MAIAAFWGTTVGYSVYYNDKIIIERADQHVMVVSRDTFDYLYFRLDEYTAALKEDCVQYVTNNFDECLFQYPEWYINACEDGIIYESCSGVLTFHDESGEIRMRDNSMVLRNYKGELKYMEPYKFHQYYDTLRE